MPPSSASPNPDEPLFDAVLTPHRSLSPAGFWLLMAGVCAASFSAGLAFMLQGAWPVLGFFGLDALLIYVAFRVSFRRGRIYEIVTLTRRELLVRKGDARGRETLWRFEPYWLAVSVPDGEGDRAPVFLAASGKRLALGTFLTPDERVEFGSALRGALAEWRGGTVLSGPSDR